MGDLTKWDVLKFLGWLFGFVSYLYGFFLAFIFKKSGVWLLMHIFVPFIKTPISAWSLLFGVPDWVWSLTGGPPW